MPFTNFTRLPSGLFMNVVVKTRVYAALAILYKQFVVDGVKVIPADIYNLLTPIALAHWIMCDGGRQGTGLVLCTDNFTVIDVVRLVNVFYIKYDIATHIHYCNGKPRIYINRVELEKLRTAVLPYMCTFSLYKLGL